MRILKLGSRQFAAGLWWQMFSAPGTTRRSGMAEARATAQSLEGSTFNMVALRKNQFGLGQWHGRSIRTLSLAAAVASRVPGTWLGRFLLEEGCWWICAVSGGAIVADGDFLCSSEGEAERHVADLRALLQWDTEVTLDTVAESHAYLLPLISVGVRVEPLFGGRGLPSSALPMLLAVVALVAAAWLYFEKQDRDAQFLALESARNRVFMSKTLEADPDSQFPAPWKGVNPAWVTVGACLEFIRHKPAFVLGWELAEVEWSEAGAKSTYQFQPGASFSDVPDDARIDPGNPTQCRTIDQVSMPKASGELQLASVEHTSKQFFELTRRLGAKGHLNFEAPMTKTVSDVQLTATWVAGSWRLSELPAFAQGEDLATLLRQVPGMTVTLVLFKSTLTLEGNIYARVRKDS